MRILSITSDPGAGGSSKSLLNLVEGLSALGHDVMIMLPSKGYLSDRLDAMGIKYTINRFISLNVWPPVYNLVDAWHFPKRVLILWLFNLLGARNLGRIIKQWTPDIIHSNNSLISIGYKASKKFNRKHIWHIREYGDKDFGFRFYPSNRYRSEILKHTPAICITHDLFTEYNIANTGQVIYNGVLSENETEYNAVKEDYFLYVGRITDGKGVTDLIQSFASYYNNGGRYKLVLVGNYDEKYHERLWTISRQAGIQSELINFIGHSDNVKDYMTKAQALIVPSKYEAFGRITAEAMFYGCLVLGRNTGGTKEQFDLGLNKTGQEIALRFESIAQLTSQMANIENMSLKEKEQYIIPAQIFAKQNFSIEQNIFQTNKFFVRVMNS